MRESRKEHWEAFWAQTDQLSLEDVYDNDGRILREIFRLTDDLSGWKILEVGAGTGRDSIALAAAGAEVFTLDYSPGSLRLIQKASQSSGSTVSVVGGDGLSMPFPDGSFDLVFHQGLLEHFRDPLPLLRENVRILKPGGVLLVDVPQRYHYYTVGKHILMLFDRWFAGWETEFTIGELEDLVEKVGLEPVMRYGDWLVPGLVYRALRKIALMSLGWRLPMYPKGIWPFNRWGESFRTWLKKYRFSLYTTIIIGVVARKNPPGHRARPVA